MQQYIDQLKDIFKVKKSLYTEIHRYYGNQPGYVKPTAVLSKLIELGYNFTQEDFNNFIILSVYNKKNGFLNWYTHNDTDTKTKTLILKTLFTKFTPNDKQLKMLLSCLSDNRSSEWVDVLISKGYQFSDTNKQILIDHNYDITKILNNNNVSLDDIKNIIKTLLLRKTTIENVIKILDIYSDQLPDDILNLVLSSYNYTDSYYYDTSLDVVIKLLDILTTKGCKFNNDVNNILINKNNIPSVLFYKLFDLGMVPDNTLKQYILNSPKLIEVALYLNKFGIKFTVDDMNAILNHGTRLSGIYTKSQYNQLVLDRVKLIPWLEIAGYNKELIVPSIDKEGYLDLYKFMIGLGIKPNMETLKIACTKSYGVIFKELTTKYKLQPTKEFLDISLLTHNKEIISEILCYKIIPDNNSVNLLLIRWSDDIFELLVKFGLVITFNDLVKILSHHITIHNLERFNIKYDEALYYHCYLNNIYPEMYDDNYIIDKKILTLRRMCRNAHTTGPELTNYIETNNVKPDRYCYDHACTFNKQLVTYFDSLKYKPTLGSYYCLNPTKDSYKYKKFVDIYKIDSEYMQGELEKLD